MKLLSSITLALLLNLPTLVGFIHSLEDEHNHCEDQSLHFHKIDLECSTCDYLRISADNELYHSDLLFNFFEKKYNYKDLLHTQSSQNFIEFYNSRGPPKI